MAAPDVLFKVMDIFISNEHFLLYASIISTKYISHDGYPF